MSAFDGDGHLFRLAWECSASTFAYLFDPFLALSTSLIEPLPYQITAVYSEMLPPIASCLPTPPARRSGG